MRTCVYGSLACWSLAWSGAHSAAAATLFEYRGHLLRAAAGKGVPGVRHLHVVLTGATPQKGACSKDVTIVSVSDGAVTLAQLLANGFRISPDSTARLCRDKATGLISERLYLSLQIHSGAELEAAYSWTSQDPRKGGAADSVTEFYNVEYHISSAAKAGRVVQIGTNA